MVEGAGAGLTQQSGQDLASQKCLYYICWAGGRKFWLCGTYRALLRGALLFESGQIRDRAPQITRWQDMQ